MTEALIEAEPALPPAAALTPHTPLSRVSVLVNAMSGSVGPKAAEEVEAILAEFGLDGTVVPLESASFDQQIDQALADRPDVLFVLAGDGTAGTVATRAGRDGPLVAPLPGGTMNMLPKALYGTTDWKAALRKALSEGEPQWVSGGKVGDHPFYCAAILGAPALWAPAREALRGGKFKRAVQYGLRAFRRAFSGRLRLSLDGGRKQKAEALVLISPLISRALDEPVGLEAAVMNQQSATDGFRLAVTALISDWRNDPAVQTRPVRKAEAWGRSRIPAVLDGETVKLGDEATILFTPKAFRALVPRPPAAGSAV